MATRQRARALSLLEMLVVMSTIALLASLLLPGLSAAREQAKGIVCRSNLSQIMLANTYYSEDHRGLYVPGAADFRRNLQRWHGTRDDRRAVFDPAHGPLAPFLGADGAVRHCPTFPSVEIAEEGGGFERGCGGYGYNNAFIGVQVSKRPSGAYRVIDDRAGAQSVRIARPTETVMFADSAFAGGRIIEYSFAEPRFHPCCPGNRMDPSIHFRHRGLANVGWCDGHVDARAQTFTWSSGFYRSGRKSAEIGWFGATDDNSLFDLD